MNRTIRFFQKLLIILFVCILFVVDAAAETSIVIGEPHTISSFGIKKMPFILSVLLPETAHLAHCLYALEMVYQGVDWDTYLQGLEEQNIMYSICNTGNEEVLQLAFSEYLFLKCYSNPVERAELIYKKQDYQICLEAELRYTLMSISKGYFSWEELAQVFLYSVIENNEVDDTLLFDLLKQWPYQQLYSAHKTKDDSIILFLLSAECAYQGMTKNQLLRLLSSFPGITDNVRVTSVSVIIETKYCTVSFMMNSEEKITQTFITAWPDTSFFTLESMKTEFHYMPSIYIKTNTTYVSNALND